MTTGVRGRQTLLGPQIGEGLWDVWGQPLLTVTPAPDRTAVNYWELTTAVTGQPVQLKVAAGSLDNDVSIQVRPKGTGQLEVAADLQFIDANTNHIIPGNVALILTDSTGAQENLKVVEAGDVTIWRDLFVGRNGRVFGALQVDLGLSVLGAAAIGGTLDVTGNTRLRAALQVDGGASFLSAVAIAGTLSAGATTLSSLGVTGNATVGGTLGVTGVTTLGVLNAAATTVTTLHATGATVLDTTLSVGTGLTVLAGGASITGNVSVTGATTLTGNVIAQNVTGNVTVQSTTGTNFATIDVLNTGGALRLGVERSTGGGLVSGSSAYAGVVMTSTATDLLFGTNGTTRLTVASGGAVSTVGALSSGTTLTAGSSLSVTTTAIIGTGLTVTTGNLAVSSGNATVSGTITAGTGLTVTTGNLTVSSGNASISGTLGAGNTTITGTLHVTSTSALDGAITTGALLTVTAGGASITAAAASALTVNRTDSAASYLPLILGQRSASTKWALGHDSADGFVLLDSTLATANFSVSNAGAAVVRAAINIGTGLSLADGGASLTNASGTPLNVNRTDAAGNYRIMVSAQRSGSQKWALGSDTSDNFNILDAAGTASNASMTNAGLLTVRAGVTVGGALTITTGGATITGTTTLNSTASTRALLVQGTINSAADTPLAEITGTTQSNTGVFTTGVGAFYIGATTKNGAGASGQQSAVTFQPTVDSNGAGTVLSAGLYVRLNVANSASGTTSGAYTIYADAPNGTATNKYAVFANGQLGINGALWHQGTTLGFFSATPASRASAYTPTNVTTDRSYNANATTVDELADVLGTLIADLQTYGLLQ